MSAGLVTFGLMVAAFGFAWLISYYSHRHWVAVWRGHQIRIRLNHQTVFFEVDDQLVCQWSEGLKRSFETEWEHPALGNTNVLIKKLIKGQDGVHLHLEIGSEIIPLFEIPRSWQGKLHDTDAYWKKLQPVEFESLGDPRWIAACKLLQLVRQSPAVDQDIREAANILQQELRKSFETKIRLSEEAVLMLGDAQKLEELRDTIEEKITQGLEAVKSLHMVTISLEAHADESAEMHKVHQIIKTLHAEEEVERFIHRISAELENPAEKRKQIARREEQDRKI